MILDIECKQTDWRNDNSCFETIGVFPCQQNANMWDKHAASPDIYLHTNKPFRAYEGIY